MLEKMSEMIAEQLNCDAETITADTSFKDDLGADSPFRPAGRCHKHQK